MICMTWPAGCATVVLAVDVVRRVHANVVVRNAHGSIDWTDPTGHHHLVPPATYPIDHTLGNRTLDVVVPNDNDDDLDHAATDTPSASDEANDPPDEGELAA